MTEFRPIPFYFINTTDSEALSRSACRAAMRDLAAAGYGGCVLFNKPPTGFDAPGYLSGFWFEVLENFILAGRELGLEMWINDGFNYPPGDAAGRIEACDSTLGQQRLRLAGDSIETVEVPWGYPAFELPESSELFIKFVYEAHREHLGKYFGNGLYGFFSDCDNRRINAPKVSELEDGRYFPWSRNFAAEFRKRCGYDIVPHLASVLRGEAPERQCDYWRVAGELYRQWFANNRKWCNDHGLCYTFHTSDTGPLTLDDCRRSSLYSEGDPLKLLAASDFPGTDHELALLDGGTHFDRRYRTLERCWGTPGRTGHNGFDDTRRDVRAKYAASAAFMNNAPRALCEMFAATNFSADFQQLGRIAMWQIMMGINFIVPHAVHHRFHGTTKYFAPPEFLHGTLRAGLAEFNARLAEACRIASTGEYCAEVAVLDPTEAVWRGDEAASANLLAVCDRLNRSAVGYVIVTRDYLERRRDAFSLVIDPAGWDGKLPLEKLPGGDVVFSGGELCFMRRRTADGVEFLIACNVWSDCELAGELAYGGKTYPLALAPGEYAVLGGDMERFRRPLDAPTVAELPMKTAVEFPASQKIPLECPVDGGAERREFVWRNAENAGALFLEWPEAFSGSIVCDGIVLHGGERIECFDDRYRRAALPESASLPGIHRIVFEGAPTAGQPEYLVGDVEVSLWVDRPSAVRAVRTYNLWVTAPRRYTMELRPRRRECLTGVPLGEQGELFYAGNSVWRWRFSLAEAAAGIDLRGCRGVCDVVLDDLPARRLIAEPYILDCAVPAGEHELRITLHGSLGALLEGGNADVRLARTIRFFR